MPLNNGKKSSKRRCSRETRIKRRREREKNGDTIVSTTTTYCQLGTACTNAPLVGKMFLSRKCRSGTTDVIQLVPFVFVEGARARANGIMNHFVDVCVQLRAYVSVLNKRSDRITEVTAWLSFSFSLSLSCKRYYYINCTVEQLKEATTERERLD